MFTPKETKLVLVQVILQTMTEIDKIKLTLLGLIPDEERKLT